MFDSAYRLYSAAKIDISEIGWVVPDVFNVGSASLDFVAYACVVAILSITVAHLYLNRGIPVISIAIRAAMGAFFVFMVSTFVWTGSGGVTYLDSDLVKKGMSSDAKSAAESQFGTRFPAKRPDGVPVLLGDDQFNAYYARNRFDLSQVSWKTDDSCPEQEGVSDFSNGVEFVLCQKDGTYYVRPSETAVKTYLLFKFASVLRDSVFANKGGGQLVTAELRKAYSDNLFEALTDEDRKNVADSFQEEDKASANTAMQALSGEAAKLTKKDAFARFYRENPEMSVNVSQLVYGIGFESQKKAVKLWKLTVYPYHLIYDDLSKAAGDVSKLDPAKFRMATNLSSIKGMVATERSYYKLSLAHPNSYFPQATAGLDVKYGTSFGNFRFYLFPLFIDVLKFLNSIFALAASIAVTVFAASVLPPKSDF